MNVKKAIKKVVALGTGLTMIGATIMGASALSLSDYPEPYVTDGMFQGKIVVGENAKTSDVLGSIDISASLQTQAKTAVSTAGTTTATTTVQGGILLEDTSNQDFNFGDYVNDQTLDKQEFPDILADGVVADDDGTEYDFEQEILVGNETLAYDLVDNDVYDQPVLYLDLDASTNTGYVLTYTIDFDSSDDLDIVALNNAEEIEMFGTSWTFEKISAGDEVVLYGSDVTQLVTMNEPVDIEVDGETYTLNIVGANADSDEVHVSVNGEVKSMSETDTSTINGLKVFVQDVFVSNIGGDSASANLFIGSRELNLGDPTSTTTDWTQVEEDNEDLDGVEAIVYDSSAGTLGDTVDYIKFRIDAGEVANADTNEDYSWLALGDSFADPMFGFELRFTEAIPDLMADSRDYVDIQSNNDDLVVTFTNEDGTEYEFSPYMEHSNGANVTYGEDFDLSAKDEIQKDTMFILEELSSGAEPVSKIFEFTGADTGDQEATFKDIGTGDTLTVGDGDSIGDTNVKVTVDAKDVVNLTETTKHNVYTESGMNISFEDVTNEATADIDFEEDAKGYNSIEFSGQTFTAVVDYDDGTDSEMTIGAPSGTAVTAGDGENDDAGDWFHGITKYGTYFVHEAEDSTSLELYMPPEEVDYNVYLAPPGATTTTSGGDTGDAYAVNAIGVGIGVLDVNAPSLGSTPMIVVGGPCVNTVAAELMGNPANCAEGFEEGKAVIKLYEDQEAILVAGMTATDTQGASRVLADFQDYPLTGSEVEVVVPSLSSISVNPVE